MSDFLSAIFSEKLIVLNTHKWSIINLNVEIINWQTKSKPNGALCKMSVYLQFFCLEMRTNRVDIK